MQNPEVTLGQERLRHFNVSYVFYTHRTDNGQMVTLLADELNVAAATKEQATKIAFAKLYHKALAEWHVLSKSDRRVLHNDVPLKTSPDGTPDIDCRLNPVQTWTNITETDLREAIEEMNPQDFYEFLAQALQYAAEKETTT